MKKKIDILILSVMISIVLTVQTKSESYINSPPKSLFVLSRWTVCVIKEDNIMSKKIPLTQGQFAIVDDNMFEYLNQWKWYAFKTTYGGFMAVRSICGNKDIKSVYMHREIMRFPKGKDIDHIDHNTLNNQEHNIRVCSRSQNHQNRRKIRGSSQYKGVCWHKHSGKWQVKITVNKKRMQIGLYANEIEGAKAYDKEAKKYFGEFIYLNF